MSSSSASSSYKAGAYYPMQRFDVVATNGSGGSSSGAGSSATGGSHRSHHSSIYAQPNSSSSNMGTGLSSFDADYQRMSAMTASSPSSPMYDEEEQQLPDSRLIPTRSAAIFVPQEHPLERMMFYVVFGTEQPNEVQESHFEPPPYDSVPMEELQNLQLADLQDYADEVETSRRRPKKKFRRPWFCLIFILLLVVGYMFSLYWNYRERGTFLDMAPFNYMVGPSPYTLIHLGATHTPCMVQTDFFNPPNCSVEEQTLYPPVYYGSYVCGNLAKYCGLGNSPVPRQWYRLFLAIFFANGLVPLVIICFVIFKFGAIMEKMVGPFRILLICLSCCVFGYMSTAIFSPRQPVSGATPAMFGIMAVLLLDLISNWKIIVKAKRQLAVLLFFLFLLFVIGLTPYLNNYSQIGGFVMGIISGLLFLPKVSFGRFSKRRKVIQFFFAIPIYFGLFILFSWLLFSGWDASNCPGCTYIDCLPLTPTFCDYYQRN